MRKFKSADDLVGTTVENSRQHKMFGSEVYPASYVRLQEEEATAAAELHRRCFGLITGEY